MFGRLGVLAFALLVASCGGGGGGAPAEFVVAFQTQPRDAIAGSTLGTIRVRANDADGNPLELTGPRVTIRIDSPARLADGRVPTLGGTLTRALTNGVALFDDLVMTGAETGYRLEASGGGTTATSTSFDIGHANAIRVAFGTQPPSVAVGVPQGEFEIRILDAYGNLVEDAARDIDIEIENFDPFGKDVILHASGTGDAGPVEDAAFEFADCEVPFLLPPETAFPPGSVDAMTFDEFVTQLVFGTTADQSLFTYDPFTGEVRVIGGGGTLSQRYKGLYVLDDGSLFGLPLDGTEEFPIDTTTGIDNRTAGRAITWPSGTIVGFQGAALDPIEGTLYAAARVASDPTGAPRLLAVDGTNIALSRGTLDDGCAGLATKFDGFRGTLFAVSPDAPRTPTLFEVNVLNARMTPVLAFGNGGVGEAITYVYPAPVLIDGPEFRARTVAGRVTLGGYRWNLPLEGVQFRVLSDGLSQDVSDRFDITPPDLSTTVAFTTAAQQWAEGAGTQTFTLTLSRAAPHDIVATIDPNGPRTTASPISDTDFSGVFTVLIRAGETSATVAFTIEEDSEAEPDELVDLRLTGVAPATLGATTAQSITILDND